MIDPASPRRVSWIRLELLLCPLEPVVVDVEMPRPPPRRERGRWPRERRAAVGVEVVAVGRAAAVVEEDRVPLAPQDVLEVPLVGLGSYFGKCGTALSR